MITNETRDRWVTQKQCWRQTSQIRERHNRRLSETDRIQIQKADSQTRYILETDKLDKRQSKRGFQKQIEYGTDTEDRQETYRRQTGCIRDRHNMRLSETD